MCKSSVPLRVWISPDLDCEGRGKWETMRIDGCIAPLVAALQAGGIDMRGSCCGHEKSEGHVHLEDGRVLLVLSPEQAEWYFAEGVPLLRRETPAHQRPGMNV